MEKLVHIPKIFEFDEDRRTRLTIGQGVHLALDGGVVLQRVEPGFGQYFEDPSYPTDEDLCIKTWLATPQAAKAWVAFDVWVDLPEGTSVGFRLSVDGDAQQFWNGSAWAAAHDHAGTTRGDWSTVQEVTDHIAEFPAEQKAIQVVVNLKTDDPALTPRVYGVGVLYEAFVDQEYDFLYSSLLPYLEEVRPVKDWVFRIEDDCDYIDLTRTPNTSPTGTGVAESAYGVGTFDPVDVVEAFDQTNDKGHATDIKKTFDASTRRLTFTDTVVAGTEVWVRFTYKPATAVITQQDYGIAAIPAIVVENVDELRGARMPDYVAFKNRTVGTAALVRSPYRATLRHTLRIVADRGRDVSAIVTALKEKLTQEPLLTAVGTDEQYSMQINKGQASFGGPNMSDLAYKRMIVDVLDVCYWVVGERTASLVTSGLKASGDLAFKSGTSERP